MEVVANKHSAAPVKHSGSEPSTGTPMEASYAALDLNKFIVALSPFSFQECSPWMVRYCTKILPSLDSAVKYLREHFVRQDVR